MKRVCFLFEGDIYNPRGEFIAIHNRLKSYIKNCDFEIDAIVCWPYYNRLMQTLTHDSNGEMVDTYQMDGVTYKCLWYQKSFIDVLTHKILKRSSSLEYANLLKQFAWNKYDLIYAHSLKCGRIAKFAKEKYGIPYVVTWHGSSIHSLPFMDRNWYKETVDVLSFADHNFYVSKELQDIAERIAPNTGSISLNGIDTDMFHKFTECKLLSEKKRLNVDANKLNIAYIGNCYPVKNVSYLPKLFALISQKIADCHFFIVGNGPFKELFTDACIDVTYLGSVQNTDMPSYYNIFDLVVLPSLKEGLPMTALEATACGTLFIGSRVGEIANVVGTEFTVARDERFEENFAKRCIEALQNKELSPLLRDSYKVDTIVQNEVNIITSLIK